MLDILTSILSGKPKPFTNLKVAEYWCKRNGSDDPPTRIAKVQQALREDMSESRPLTVESLQAALHLDAYVQEAFEAICFQYVSNPRMPKALEQQLWGEITSFANDMLDGYRRYVHMVDGESMRAQFQPYMPLTIARSLRYISILAKWHYFRFDKVSSKLWTTAHQLYRLSEIDGFDSNPFPLYPALSEEVTSSADEYIRLLMLATLSGNNLSVTHLNTIDHWLEKWSKYIQLSRKYHESQHHYCISLQDGAGPQRVTSDCVGEFFRFWGVGELVAALHEMLVRLESGKKPKDLGLGEGSHATVCQEILRHLVTYWTMNMRNSQISRSERRKVRKTAHVAHGLDRICGFVKEDNQKAFGETPEEPKEDRRGAGLSLDQDWELRLSGHYASRSSPQQTMRPYAVPAKTQEWFNWTIDNESVGGYGAVLRFSENEWVRPGTLLGVRIVGDEQKWQVGVLRRLNRMEGDEVYAGIQILTTTPVRIHLRSEEKENLDRMSVSEMDYTGSFTIPGARSGMYVPYRTEKGESLNTLVIHSSDYAHERVYEVVARDKSFFISLGAVIDKGIDWSWVSVSVLQQPKTQAE